MKKSFIKLATVFILIFTFAIKISAVSIEKNTYDGVEINTMEEILAIADTTPTTRALPISVDNTSLFPTPGNQGSQNSCVSWAVGYAVKSNNELNKRDWTISENRHQFSPAYLYNQLVNPNSEDKLTNILDTMALVKAEGVCPLTYFPYNSSDYLTQPNAIQTAAASLYKGLTYYSALNTTKMKEVIAQGSGVVISIKTYPDFKNISSSNPVFDNSSGAYTGNHAICLIGYDDSYSGGAFKFINSYGTSWGINGYGWITYNMVNSFVNSHGPGVGFYMTAPATDNYIMGDVDDDGEITSFDSRLALNISVNNISFTATEFVLADVDGDGTVSASDSREIMRYSTGLITKFSLYD